VAQHPRLSRPLRRSRGLSETDLGHEMEDLSTPSFKRFPFTLKNPHIFPARSFGLMNPYEGEGEVSGGVTFRLCRLALFHPVNVIARIHIRLVGDHISPKTG
jgi:hypothetical protein